MIHFRSIFAIPFSAVDPEFYRALSRKIEEIVSFSRARAKRKLSSICSVCVLHERNSFNIQKVHAISNGNHFTSRVINAGETFPVRLSAADGGDSLEKYQIRYSARLRMGESKVTEGCAVEGCCAYFFDNENERANTRNRRVQRRAPPPTHTHTDTARQSVTKLARAQCEPAFARENRIGRLPKPSLE